VCLRTHTCVCMCRVRRKEGVCVCARTRVYVRVGCAGKKVCVFAHARVCMYVYMPHEKIDYIVEWRSF